MKSVLAFAAMLGLLWPTVALADPPDCARLLRQIYHHEDMVTLAEDQDQLEWAEKTQDHVDQLEYRLAERCPRYSSRDEKQEIARSLATLLKVSASVALKLLTLGAL